MKNILAKRAAEYSKTKNGDTTVFSVTPASGPKFWYLIVIGTLIFLAGFMGLGIFAWVMGGGAVAYGLFRDQRPAAHKTPASFSVTPASITAGGKTFSKDEFHRLILKNPILERAGLDVYTSNANIAAGMEQVMKLGEVCYGLDVETGGKAHYLAGGMDYTTAFGLLTDTSRILGLETK
ncbi:MAG: hypothetical protein SGJ21_00655 [Alphaproteobacteria bacterium]|nr:hypothetical protein [Alphaproteobacteria bacterium]